MHNIPLNLSFKMLFLGYLMNNANKARDNPEDVLNRKKLVLAGISSYNHAALKSR